MDKVWIGRGLRLLDKSLNPPHELNELDWKTGLSGDKKRLSAHLSAFANQAGGGFLVFGINNSGAKVGVDLQQSKEIIDRLGKLSQKSLEPSVRIDHYFHKDKQNQLLFIYVEESKSKPVHLRGKGIEHSYIRTGCSTHKMDREQLAQALMSSRLDHFEELDACTLNSPEEVFSLLECHQLFEISGITVPTSTDNIIEKLEKTRIIRIAGEQIIITNLGVLLLCKDFENFPGFERKGIRVIVYDGTSRINAKMEKVGRGGYAVSFKPMFEYIMQSLPSSEIIKDVTRQDIKVYPDIAIREIMANAIIHQDLHNNSINPKVEIFTDRIEISNPGLLVQSVSLDRVIDHADPRNELLARVMYHLGFCEDRGSGIDRAINEIEIYNLPPIKFEELANIFKVTIYSPKNYQDMSQDERVAACYQHCVLKYLENEKMTNQTFRKRLKVAETNYPLVSKIIKQAVKEGKIKVGDFHNKSKKFTHYLPSWA